MPKFLIEGQHPLRGEIAVSGMKNAATPILAATLLTSEECILDNVPRIVDVFKMMELLKSAGSDVAWTGEHQITLRSQEITPNGIAASAVKSLRSSVLLIGPLLTRAREFRLARPGGCIIGNRPLDTHLDALRALGAVIDEQRDELFFRAERLRGAEIVLAEFSVTATENVLLSAVLAEGTTVLHIAAAEPHVQDLIRFLRRMGANIEGSGTHTLVIHGVTSLHGAHHNIIPDQIEVGTLPVAAAATRGSLTMTGIIPDHLHLILKKLHEAGIAFLLTKDTLSILSTHRLQAFRLQTMPYPGFPTDLQAPFSILATQAEGTSLLHDPMFEGRMGYVQELVKMGANAVVCDPHRVLITGPTPLYGQEITGFDLRAGATLILAGLIARGTTVIHGAEIVDRGYERFDDRLRSLGAVISRIP